jgi:type I restriction enzyme S subunit
VDTLKTRLDAIPSILKRFRQSTLAAATSGKLTEQWREENKSQLVASSELITSIRLKRRQFWEQAQLDKFDKKGKRPKGDSWKDKYVETELPDVSSLPELPSSWGWVAWEDILAFNDVPFKRGPFGSSLKKSMFVEEGYKVYEQYCPINDDCSFARYFITPEKFSELEAFSVKARDFLISCSGVTLGRITQVPDDFDVGVINQALLRVRLNQSVYNDQFFIRLFRSQYFQKQIFDNATGSAIPNVKGVKELKAIPVPLLDSLEQTEIVRRVEELFAFADQVEQRVNDAQARVNHLTQSILAKAFRGELTEDWRAAHPELISGENSAEALLKRIKTEREKLTSKKKTRKKGGR